MADAAADARPAEPLLDPVGTSVLALLAWAVPDSGVAQEMPPPGLFPPSVPDSGTLPPGVVPRSTPEGPPQTVAPLGVTPRSNVYSPPVTPGGAGTRQGMLAGPFVLRTGISAGLAYDDNIHADDKDRESDLIWTTRANVRAESDLRRHSFGLQASVGYNQFTQHPGQSSFHWQVGADGRLDLSRSSDLSGTVTYTRDKEDNESPTTSGNAKGGNSFYDLVRTELTYSKRIGVRWTWRLLPKASRTVYEDSSASDRDRWTYGASADVNYKVSDRLSVFAGPDYSRIQYDNPSAEATSSSSQHSSQEVDLKAGGTYQVGARLLAQGFLGYGWKFFDDGGQDDTVIFGGNLRYLINARTSAYLDVNRSFAEANAENASTSVLTSLSLRLSRLLRRDLTLETNIGVAHTDFIDTSDADDTVFAQLGLTRTLTDSVSLTASYRYSQRISNQSSDDFYRNVFQVGVTFGF